MEFRDLGKLDIAGIYPNYAAAYALKAKAQQTVDNAHMPTSSCIVRLLDPGKRIGPRVRSAESPVSFLKRLSRPFQKTTGVVAAEYLRLV